MPLSRDKYDELIAKGLTHEQIARFASGGGPQAGGYAESRVAQRSTLLGNAPREDDLLSGLIDVGLPLGGGIAGGILGIPGGPPGIITGAALGGAGGEAYRQNARALMGYASPETSGEAAGRIGTAAATDAALAGTGLGAAKLGGRLAAPAARLAARVADAPLIRRIPGARMVRNMAEDVVEVSERSKPGSGAAESRMTEAPTAPKTPQERLNALQPVRKNQSDRAIRAKRAELEQIMSEAKLDAPTKRWYREKLGYESPKSSRAKMGVVEGTAPKGSAASRVKPDLKRVEGGKPRAEIVEATVEDIPPQEWKAKYAEILKGKRHPVQHFSEGASGKAGKAVHVDIETMHPAHLRAAINKHQRTIAKVGAKRAPVAKAELDAMLKELTYRMENVGQHTAY